MAADRRERRLQLVADREQERALGVLRAVEVVGHLVEGSRERARTSVEPGRPAAARAARRAASCAGSPAATPLDRPRDRAARAGTPRAPAIAAPTAAAIANAIVNGRRSEASSFADRSSTIARLPLRLRGVEVALPADRRPTPAARSRAQRSRRAAGGSSSAACESERIASRSSCVSKKTPRFGRRRRPTTGLLARRSAPPAARATSSASWRTELRTRTTASTSVTPTDGDDRDRDRRELPRRAATSPCSRSGLDRLVARRRAPSGSGRAGASLRRSWATWTSTVRVPPAYS